MKHVPRVAHFEIRVEDPEGLTFAHEQIDKGAR